MNPRKSLSILAVLVIVFPTLALAAHAQSTPGALDNGPHIYLQAGEFDPLVDNEPSGLPKTLRTRAVDDDTTAYQIVQFNGPITPAEREALDSRGVEILDYLPDFAYVVRMPGATRSTVQALPEVRWVGAYQPAYRLSPELYANLSQPIPNISIDLVVDVFNGEALDSIVRVIKSLDGVVMDQTQTNWKSKLIISLPAGQVLELASIPGVRWIEPAPEWQLYNDVAVGIMNVRDVWNTHGLYGNGQTVGICDSGLDKGSTAPGLLHDDFENGSGASRVTAIFDVAGDGNTADTIEGHGTHVAGSVLGNGNESGSTPSTHTYPDTAYAGVAPEAGLVFQASEVYSTGQILVPGDLNVLFAQAAANGADLHTNSWGNPGPGLYTESSAEVDQYIWDHPDFPILYSAGNEGIDSNADGVVDLTAIGSPGTAKNVITVGASENLRPDISWAYWGYLKPSDFPTTPITDDLAADNTDGMAAFSSRGPTQDGRIKPDLVAPGTFIISTKSSVMDEEEDGWGPLNDKYFYMGGTSMSTPLAAGAAT
ncbi:MAG: S8 family serine peptidase, partial [Anaerolineales bacterium]|nr:S8 family serine peptidase [Anaerolineales bacterium]